MSDTDYFFICPQCGPHVASDDEGLCVTCGLTTFESCDEDSYVCRLVRERDEARAESIALKGTIDEAGIGVLPCVVVGKVLRPDGTMADLAVNPDTMTGLWAALREKARTLVPWAQSVIEGESSQRIRAERAEARVAELEKERAALKRTSLN